MHGLTRRVGQGAGGADRAGLAACWMSGRGVAVFTAKIAERATGEDIGGGLGLFARIRWLVTKADGEQRKDGQCRDDATPDHVARARLLLAKALSQVFCCIGCMSFRVARSGALIGQLYVLPISYTQ